MHYDDLQRWVYHSAKYFVDEHVPLCGAGRKLEGAGCTRRDRMPWPLCKFPRALATNYHKLDGFKQQKSIFLVFLKPKVPNGFVGLKNQSMDRIDSFWRLQGRFLSLSASSGCWHALASGCITRISSIITSPSPLLWSNFPHLLLIRAFVILFPR